MKYLLVLIMAVAPLFGQFDMAHTPRNIQAPYVAADFWTQWSSVNPRVCLMVKVTPKDAFGGSSAAIGFTSNTRDMTLPGHVGLTFKSAPGITPSSIETMLDEPSNLEMLGMYQSGSFTQADVMAGKWNFAEVEVFCVSWENTSLGEFLLFRGNLGDFKDYQTHFNAEARGLLSRLSNDVDMVTQRFCRHDFGDTKCQKNLSGTVTISGTVYNITETGLINAGSDIRLDFDSTAFVGNIPPDDFYANGKATCTAGNNIGVSREIASSQYFSGNSIYSAWLKRPFPFDPEGDTFTIVAGCNKTIEHCMRYDNIINRGAEDWIPGVESLRRIPTPQ